MKHVSSFFLQIHNLFNDDIVKFFQIPGLEDEIAILDEKKRVWYGTMGRNIIRKKTIFEPNVCFVFDSYCYCLLFYL